MFSLLPDLTPRDSHSLWYSSSRNPLSSTSGSNSLYHDASSNPHDSQQHGGAHTSASPNRRTGGSHLIERSLLARLRADEANLSLRRANVTNFGSGWLKPPGLPKTLHQLREERREAEEHQETLRREALAQELAEAGAGDGGEIDAVLDGVLEQGAGEGEGELGEGGDEDVDGDGMDDVQLDGTRDLDDDIPEADAADFGLSVDDEDETQDEDDDDDDEDEEGDPEDDLDPEEREMRAAHAAQQNLMAQRMRQAMGGANHSAGASVGYYGADEDIDDEDQSQMLEEEDLVGGSNNPHHGDEGEMDMDADLDDDIPEASDSMGGYEHTDTEAELTSDDDRYDNTNTNTNYNNSAYGALPPPPHQQRVRFSRQSLARSDATRNSIAISDMLSRDGSSVMGSSPQVQRPHGHHPQQMGRPSPRRGGRG